MHKSLPSSPRKSRSVSRLSTLRCSPSSAGLQVSRSPSPRHIPAKDVKILEGMMRRRKDERLRSEMSERFHQMWWKELEEQKKFQEELKQEYQRLVSVRRLWQSVDRDRRQLQKDLALQARREEMERRAREKEQRSRHILELAEEMKMEERWWRHAMEVARGSRAQWRRCGLREEEKQRRRHDAEATCLRAAEAEERRSQHIRDNAQRAAITNRLSRLESWHHQSEAAAADRLRRETARAHVRSQDQRARTLERERNAALSRSRQMAAYTAALREALRGDS